MKKIAAARLMVLPLAACAFLLAGCLPALYPLHTPDTLTFQEGLLGIWKENPDDEESWHFTRGEQPDTYDVVIKDDSGPSRLRGHLVKLGDHLFLDLSATSEQIEGAGLGNATIATLIPGHLHFRARLGSRLELRMINLEKLREYLEAHPDELTLATLEKDRVVITSPTAALQKFYTKHADSQELWGDPIQLNKLLL